MSRAYRLTAVVNGSAWVRTPDDILLGRVDRVNGTWVAVPPSREHLGGILGEDLPGVFSTRFAAAEALLRHHEEQP